jgi:hypothetical protein
MNFHHWQFYDYYHLNTNQHLKKGLLVYYIVIPHIIPNTFKTESISKIGNDRKLSNSLQVECETPKTTPNKNGFISVNFVFSVNGFM